MLCKMRTLAAGPEYILQPGKVYNLPKSVVSDLLNTDPPSAERVTNPEKVERIPAQPDPEEKKQADLEDDSFSDASGISAE